MSVLLDKRHKLGLTRKQVAAKCDCTAQMILLIEQGSNVPNIILASKHAEALEMTLGEYVEAIKHTSKKLNPELNKTN